MEIPPPPPTDHRSLLALAQTIEADRKSYYQALQATNTGLELDQQLRS